MLAICEECSKKYNVDESKIKGERARFSCQQCGHVIVVIKPPVSTQTTEPDNSPVNESPT